MAIRLLPTSGHVTERWKNGHGLTDEICLLPAGATRDAFDLRISRATLSGAGLFSAFPGVQRTITLIEGAGLALDFGNRLVRLRPWQSYTFDSGLTPVGRPQDGPVRVVNVMGARSAWQLSPALSVCEVMELAPVRGGLAVVFALKGATRLSDGGNPLSMLEGDCALVGGRTRLAPEDGSAALVVPLEPAGATS